ncbi:ribosome rescue GTPase HflX [Coxiella burnetii]|uniref:ribosome rescue GTPase HflX n=1 Tax=Coxiella burnetii TaxID=777 RepID=UPI00051F1B66|nr:ribosome rescue GTPase HflX [Coxiella burnetii]AIT63120.1 GTPase HflX [Coxiella burnetii str. Namibia]
MRQTRRYFIDRHEGGERIILVHIDFPTTQPDSLREFKELAHSSGGDVLTVVKGKRNQPESKYFVGTGKAEEIQQTVHDFNADLVLFNHELSPAQERNLEKLFQCRVLDRTGLILDIFAQRAHTFEGKLQVELAQLKHLSTRLVRGWGHLERQRGGIGLRGPGETQLETDRRLIGGRIKMINKRLDKVVRQRQQGQRARKRSAVPTVSLVGYTNAGKSTLFNAITEANVYTADQLFATLDPTFRQLELPTLGKIILVDTVGFIRDLPHDLIAAFRATLEESRQADLLLHVVDAHSPDSSVMLEEVQKVLETIGAEEVPQLFIYNKIDLLESRKPRIDYDEKGKPRRVWLSALTGVGIDLLNPAIVELLGDTILTCEVTLEANEGKLRSTLYKMGVIKAEKIDPEGHMQLTLEIQRKDYQRLFEYRARPVACAKRSQRRTRDVLRVPAAKPRDDQI